MSAAYLTPMATQDYNNPGLQRRRSLDGSDFNTKKGKSPPPNDTSSTSSRPLSKLDKLEMEIRQVEQEQNQVQEALEKKKGHHGMYDQRILEENLRRLWKKEEQLRTKEEQVRQKELLLLTASERGGRGGYGEALRLAETEEFQLDSEEPARMSCKFRTVAGKVFEIHNLLPSTTVKELKAIISHQQGVSEEDQAFLFAGRQMQDGQTLGYYKITDQSMVHMVMRIAVSNPGGGGFRQSVAW